MAHKTRVNGTTYEIKGGKTRVNGTGYSIKGGKTRVGGTAYEISFISADPILGNNDPATIQAVAKAGQAENYWAVGDTIGISLSGTVGVLTLSGTYYAFIIGFNHNSSREGNNTIHFQFGKNSSGVDIAFVDDTCGSDGSGDAFRMNISSETNSGGWSSSYMRKTICADFVYVMPSAWRSVIASCTKYSDNTGKGSNTASYVTSTSDKIWLLSEFEVHGARSYANSAEQNYQKQYAYYANGNSKAKYWHTKTTTVCQWWLRSVHATSTANFCYVKVSSNGSASAANSSPRTSQGFAPGFMVA